MEIRNYNPQIDDDIKIIYVRNNYYCNTPTPLCRGVSHLLFSIIMSIFIPYAYHILQSTIFGAYLLMISSYIASAIYHCVKLNLFFEKLVRYIDHIFIHNHIISIGLIYFDKSIFTHLCLLIFLVNYTYDAFHMFWIELYIESYYHKHTYILSMIISLSMFAYAIISDHVDIYIIIVQCISILLYLYGQYFFLKTINEIPHHIISNHEIFHIITVIASIGTIYVMFNCANSI